MKRLVGSIGVLFAVFATTQAWASGPIEVVQSVPLETTLEVPGIPKTQDVWLKMIGSAKTSIDLEQFYIYSQKGESLEPVLNALRTAAANGVHIRFIVDSKFYKTYPQEPDSLGRTPNIEVKVIDYSSHGGIQHSKFFVVDGKEAFVGSANFDWLALSHIHEIGLHISDADVAKKVESVFQADWTGAKPVTEGEQGTPDPRIQVLASPPATTPSAVGDTLKAITAIIGKANTSVKVQVYEYSTAASGGSAWRELDNALRAAAKRGVQVQLLVDQHALQGGKVDLQALAAVPNLQVRTVTIPEWSGGHLDYARLVHSKYFVVDGTTSWVGSENWSRGYFYNCRNVGAAVQGADIGAALTQIFDRVWNSAYSNPVQ